MLSEEVPLTLSVVETGRAAVRMLTEVAMADILVPVLWNRTWTVKATRPYQT